ARWTSGAGEDILYGAGGADWLLGGTGNDVVAGGGGNDILAANGTTATVNLSRDLNLLIGGDGADRLRGGSLQDILVAGSTAWDQDAQANQSVLAAILYEWATGRGVDATFLDRQQYILSHYFTAGNLHDDSSVDTLTGDYDKASGAADWFVADLSGAAKDVISDLGQLDLESDLRIIG